jgi:plastocyanin
MTDTMTPDGGQPDDEGRPGTEVEPAGTTTTTLERPAEKAPEEPQGLTSFWQRPLVDRFLSPLILPALVVLFVVVYVLNVSRLFLSMHGHIPVIAGTVITLLLIGGATLLANARLRQSGVLLLSIAFLVAIAFGGWISLGHSENKEAAAVSLPATLKTDQTVKIIAAPGGQLIFDPNSVANIKTGLVKFDVDFAAAGHTFGFHQADTDFAELKPTAAEPMTGVAFFPAAGEYTFYCSIPGHEAAGMHGTVTVTGPPKTLDEALKETGNPPLAGG